MKHKKILRDGTMASGNGENTVADIDTVMARKFTMGLGMFN